MRDHEPRVLLLPGIGDSAAGHWQSRWEASRPGFVRVRQRDWDAPAREDWCQTLEAALAQAGEGVVLAAHSLGCLLIAHWAMATRRQVRGALIVAPPDPDGLAFPTTATGFAPVPLRPLPFPSIVVASEDDPYASFDFAIGCARAWGGRLVSVGARGHINADSGLGDWTQGLDLLRELGVMDGGDGRGAAPQVQGVS
ncbi:hypothetical protein BI364_02135 [Acidihalobacter yilgarnensis]|uniref:Alpha/beta hydrolase n=1 Tax=Acidihalobacter yilgarnensis TaxID=2819280 RepID=A0A1D8IKH2_9GAMM|nr:alpha/beta fold hydrolase [Acidihalobacter yilgarnensis]AOU96966.1 hypothetical protein BI364_02135 [Acidihalobacter yilgarnensis]